MIVNDCSFCYLCNQQVKLDEDGRFRSLTIILTKFIASFVVAIIFLMEQIIKSVVTKHYLNCLKVILRQRLDH